MIRDKKPPLRRMQEQKVDELVAKIVTMAHRMCMNHAKDVPRSMIGTGTEYERERFLVQAVARSLERIHNELL